MRPAEREELRHRFNFCCGYCGVSETDVGAVLTVDHFQPRAHGGAHTPENWVYCCFTCNTNKSDVWAPEAPRRILHPHNDTMAEHLAEQPDGTLIGLTVTGIFHVAQLQLNRPQLMAHRRARRQQTALQQRLTDVLERQEVLRQRVEALERAVAAAERRLIS